MSENPNERPTPAPMIGVKIGPEAMVTDHFERLADAIQQVATSSPFKAVNVAAIEAFRALTKIENVTLQDCTISMGQPVPAPTPEEKTAREAEQDAAESEYHEG